MARTDNLRNFMEDIATSIKNKKGISEETKILAKNFDTEINEIHLGPDTSDATAVANDISVGQTAYVDDVKVTGTLTKYDENRPFMYGMTNDNASYATSFGTVDVLKFGKNGDAYCMKSNYAQPNGVNDVIVVPRLYIQHLVGEGDYVLRIFPYEFTSGNVTTHFRAHLIVAPNGAKETRISYHDSTYDCYMISLENTVVKGYYYTFFNDVEDLKDIEWRQSGNTDPGMSNEGLGYYFSTVKTYSISGGSKSTISFAIDPTTHKYLSKLTPGTNPNKDKIIGASTEIYMPIKTSEIANQEGVLPENIKKGITILGVDGELESAGEEAYFDMAPEVANGYFYKFSRNYECLFYPGMLSLIKQLPSNIKLTGNVVMFMYCVDSYITQYMVNVVTWDTVDVTNMSEMFANNSTWTELDLSTMRTDNCTNFSYMFYDDKKLTKLNLKNFNPANINNYTDMFYGVPATCEIITNQTMADWFNTNIKRGNPITIVKADWE